MNEEPHSPWQRVRGELTDARQWLDRTIVLTYAVATGVIVVGFTHLAESASNTFNALTGNGTIGHWSPLIWTPALAVALLWLTRHFATGH